MKEPVHELELQSPVVLGPSVWSDLLELTKPRITGFVALAATVGGVLGAAGRIDLARLFEVALYVSCAAAGASVFNQIIERDTDALMVRTRSRPLPAGRIAPREAILFAAALTAVATVGLAWRFSLLSSLLALATLCLYALVYTPLKRASTLNTVIGALPGAAPPLIAFTATAGDFGPWGWALFATLFVWQFPHFMAIAWMYRDDYNRAGLRMLSALPGTEHLGARQALIYGLAIVPVSLLPGVRGEAGVVFAIGVLVLGAAYVLAAANFAWKVDLRSARALLLVSLAYLPLYFLLVLLDPVIRVSLHQAIS